MTDLFAPYDERARYEMRAPCKCGELRGYILTRNGQDTIRCLACDTFQYNAPKVETGRAVRSMTDRPTIKPGRRRRLLERDGGRCVLCGNTENLEIDHLISRALADRHGLLDELIDSDDNLAAMCRPCNNGKDDLPLDPRIMIRLLVIRAKQPRP